MLMNHLTYLEGRSHLEMKYFLFQETLGTEKLSLLQSALGKIGVFKIISNEW